MWPRSCSCYLHTTCLQWSLILRARNLAALQGSVQQQEVTVEGRANGAVRQTYTWTGQLVNTHKTALVKSISYQPCSGNSQGEISQIDWAGFVGKENSISRMLGSWKVANAPSECSILVVWTPGPAMEWSGIRRPISPAPLLLGLTTWRRWWATEPTRAVKKFLGPVWRKGLPEAELESLASTSPKPTLKLIY